MIRRRVLNVVVLIPALVVAIFVAATLVLQEDNRSGRLVRDADRAHALLRLEIDEAAASLHAQLDLLADDADLVAAIAAGNGGALERRIGPIFAHLRDQHGVSHLYFFRPDRSPLLRMDGAGKNGQVVDRLTLFETAESLGQSDGLDLNAFGLLTLRVTVGWRDGSGKLLGFVEIGRDVAPLIDAVHRIMGLDILLLVNKSLLDRDKWDLGERQSGGQGSWDELNNTVSVARTLATIPVAVGIAIEDSLPSARSGITIVSVGRHSLAMSVQPLIDLEKKAIGNVVLLRDVTEASHAMARTMILLIGSAAALTAIGYFICRSLLAAGSLSDAADRCRQNS